MGYRTKVQVIKRAKSRQFYVSFPSALAQAMDFQPSELVEWVVTRKGELLLRRVDDEGHDEARG